MLFRSLLLLLNPDAVLDRKAVLSLLARAEREPRSLVAPVLTDSEGRVVADRAVVCLADWSMRSPRSSKPIPPGGTHPWLSGACLALSTRLFETVGGFDERYFLYWEDVDFSRRVVSSGGALVLAREAVAVHDEGGTQRDGDADAGPAKSDAYYYYNIRNRLLYAAYALFNITMTLGVDGISVMMIALSSIIVFTGVFSSWNMDMAKEFFLWYCLLTIGVFGFFITIDLFSMFMFYEVALIPMYLLIGLWGTGKKEYSAMKLTLMLMGGSAFLMIGIIGIFFASGATTFNIVDIANSVRIPIEHQRWIFPVTFLGFGVLGALFPFHTWSPDGHASAPTMICRCKW